jgi:hypothetical protein
MTSARLLLAWVAALVILSGGCTNQSATTSQGSGGNPGTGGASETGGTTGSGGSVGTGGTTSSGGSVGTGGTASSGGQTATGGATGSGGSTGSGGRTGTGGAMATGGDVGSGGATAPGGETGTGGTSATGGRIGRDGGPDVPGGTGGAATGGGPGTGGGGGSGGGGSGGTTSTSTDPREPGNAPVPSPGCGKAPTITNGVKTITSAGLSRQYTIEIPTDYDNSKPYKLFIGFHWMGATMQNVVTGNTVSPANSWNWFGLKRLDTSHEYIMVAPQGIDNGWANTDGRDLAFTDDMIKIFKEGLCIDESRIFAGGFSYGGMWSSTLSCQRGNVFRALSPQNGSANCQTPVSKVAFICFGSNDGTKTSLLTLARTHAKNNGCADANQSMPQPEAGSLLHTCTSFTGCPAAFPVRYCAFDQNHKSTPYDGGCAECDDGLKSWLPGEIWKFYEQF